MNEHHEFVENREERGKATIRIPNKKVSCQHLTRAYIPSFGCEPLFVPVLMVPVLMEPDGMYLLCLITVNIIANSIR